MRDSPERGKHLSVIFLGSQTSNRTGDADYKELAILSSALSKPYAEFCLFSKSPNIIYYLEVTMAFFTTFILGVPPLIPTSTLRLPRFTEILVNPFPWLQ